MCQFVIKLQVGISIREKGMGSPDFLAASEAGKRFTLTFAYKCLYECNNLSLFFFKGF
jgi:hypothetical protein